MGALIGKTCSHDTCIQALFEDPVFVHRIEKIAQERVLAKCACEPCENMILQPVDAPNRFYTKKDADAAFSRIDHDKMCIEDDCLTQEDFKVFKGERRVRIGIGDGPERVNCYGDGLGTCRVLKYEGTGNAVFSEGGYQAEFGEMSTRDFLLHFTSGCPGGSCRDNKALVDESLGAVPYNHETDGNPWPGIKCTNHSCVGYGSGSFTNSG